ncbi:hypothetical protein BDW22DRAFT_1360375 [Trametopsis cervina]|nr:hypothetical protein BDW22DRAFT_1360375 [Trametopsis cervina]
MNLTVYDVPRPVVIVPVRSADIVSTTIVAFATLLVYDILCTFPEEVTLVWSHPWSIRSWVYILNRYPPLIDTFLSMRLLTTIQPPDVCERDFKVVTWMIVSGVILAESILMLRTYAIFERKRWISIFLPVLLLAVTVPSCVIVKLELDTVKYGIPPSGIYSGCALARPTSVIIFAAYLLVLCSETIIVLLTIYKAARDLRHCRAPLVLNLYRNGMIFYVYTLLISLANVIVPVAGPASLDNWLATPQRVLHSLFCARVLLSILRSGNTAAHDTSQASDSSGGTSLGFQRGSLGFRHGSLGFRNSQSAGRSGEEDGGTSLGFRNPQSQSGEDWEADGDAEGKKAGTGTGTAAGEELELAELEMNDNARQAGPSSSRVGVGIA